MNKKFLFSLFGSLTLLCLVSTNLPCYAQVKGWTLTQRSEYMGDQYIYVCKSGFKWVSPKAGANIVTSAPQWTVTMFNDKTKQYFVTTFAKWKSQMVQAGGRRAKQMQAARWKKSGSGTISGLKATKYVMAGNPKGGSGKLSGVKRASCWVSDDIEVPGPIADMLSQAYGMPRTKYYPLRVTYLTNRGQVKTALDTYRSSVCTIPPAYFGSPSGYQLASSQAEILMDDDTRQLLKDMAGELDGAPSKPTQKKAVAKKKQKQTATPKPKPGSTADQLTKLLDSLKGK